MARIQELCHLNLKNYHPAYEERQETIHLNCKSCNCERYSLSERVFWTSNTIRPILN
jgi:hypothetical protein